MNFTKTISALADDSYTDRCIGSILGCCIGDILGANVEFLDMFEIAKKYGKPCWFLLPTNPSLTENELKDSLEDSSEDKVEKKEGVINFLNSYHRPKGVYTDDTEMTYALADSLVIKQACDAKHISETYAKYFMMAPRRGYGPSVHIILDALYKGADYRTTGRMQFKEGSYGNGSVMRIAPIGLSFRNASDEILKKAVFAACMCTHVHEEALDAAFVQAKAISLLF